MKKIKSQL